MAFKPVGGIGSAPLMKWTTVGQVLEGRFVGQKRGKTFNNRASTLGVFDVGGGVQVVVSFPTALENIFLESNIQPGAVVRITYLGKVQGKNQSQPYHSFTVEVDDGGAGAPTVAPQVAPQSAPGSRYDVLVAGLSAKVGPSFSVMYNMLTTMYPDHAAREAELEKLAKQQGVV